MKIILKKNRFAFLLVISLILSFCSIAMRVTAEPEKAAKAVTWKNTIFGQSTSSEKNKIEVNKDSQTVTISAGVKDGSAAGGKITGSHDGIAYYYTEIPAANNFELSAKVKVNFFAKATPDNQEGFGIMARDAIGKDQDTTVFPSNMVMIGGYRGAIQSVFRNNVKDASGAGTVMENVCKFSERPANDGSITYLLKLRKTNTGYHVAVDNGPEKIYYRPKQLEILDTDRVYVGFFAARVASITVSEITLKLSEAATDLAGIPDPSLKPVTPAVNIDSPSTSATANYQLKVLANLQGKLEIVQNGKSIYNGPIDSTTPLVRATTLIMGKNIFDIVYNADSVPNTNPAAPIRLQQTVMFKTYGKAGEPIYVSPKAKIGASGSKNNPTNIYSAVLFAQPGQKIYVRGGTYYLDTPILIEKGNNGTADKLKILSAYPGEKPIFDFGKKANGLILSGDYWKIYGIGITNAATTGCRISGNHNLIELVNTYANGDTGLQISGSSMDKSDKWPSYNLILNCTSYDNRDPAENNADGFAAKLTCGVGNVFRGCIAHHNCDDGYDLYSKLETGPIGVVIIENCIAYGNGNLSDGAKTKGDGNGFKLGGEGLIVKHLLRNSLAFKNNGVGVTSNSNPAIIVENTTAADNGSANYSFACYSKATPQFSAKNNISFRTVAGVADQFPTALGTADNYFFNGTVAVNSLGKKITATDFQSVTPKAFGRNASGEIIANQYLAFKANATITAGAHLGVAAHEKNQQKSKK